ncbi:myeloid-derived growth factor-like [Asterias rubens]|uniref:myeloid-derived growth factor-like n=1 Tax=Asterias rubens TaxID=7604 RepID=UPI001454F283|nr:myeloid-derived growth factor-like [Asterias rubens]
MAAPTYNNKAGKLICFYINLLLITLILLCKGISCNSSLSEHFDVKPGGQVWTVVKELGSFKCTFEYAAQGGTNEKWLFELTKADSTFVCDIQRPSGVSYLFFQSFKVSVDLKGSQLQEAELFMDTDNHLKQEEFIVNKGKKEVTHNEGKFNSKLSRVLLIADVDNPRTDL